MIISIVSLIRHVFAIIFSSASRLYCADFSSSHSTYTLHTGSVPDRRISAQHSFSNRYLMFLSIRSALSTLRSNFGVVFCMRPRMSGSPSNRNSSSINA